MEQKQKRFTKLTVTLLGSAMALYLLTITSYPKKRKQKLP